MKKSRYLKMSRNGALLDDGPEYQESWELGVWKSQLERRPRFSWACVWGKTVGKKGKSVWIRRQKTSLGANSRLFACVLG